MIVLRDVWYKYGDLIAIRNINASFDKGVTFIIGPNASGKTTLLKIASTLYRPFRGHIIIDNMNPWRSNGVLREIRKNIVYVYEKPILFRGTVLENLTLPLIYRGIDDKEAKSIAIELLDSFGLRGIANKRRNELSAGQKQMVSLLRGFITKPKYLLLDEPTNALDLKNRKKIIQYINEQKEKTTIIIATHDLLLPLELKGRILRMENGEIVEELDTKKFTERYVFLEEIKNDSQ